MKYTPESLLKEALSAVSLELEAVRERPSREVLLEGKRVDGSGEGTHYRFSTTQMSLRFAEVCQAVVADREFSVSPVEGDDQSVTLRFPEDIGEQPAEVLIEWENDFVLRRLHEQLQALHENQQAMDRIARMIDPVCSVGADGQNETSVEYDDPTHRRGVLWGTNDAAGTHDHETSVEYDQPHSQKDISSAEHGTEGPRSNETSVGYEFEGGHRDDGARNKSQRLAIQRALQEPVSYIWGPPGTGKTATLAYIMANYLLQGKRVLFVSNTNRAVDHGMLGLVDAMQTLGINEPGRRITRFGDRVLAHPRLEEIHFEEQLARRLHSRKQQAADLQHWLEARALPDLSEDQQRLIAQKIESLGGETELEERIQELLQGERTAFFMLKRFRVAGTTLARVCTSELMSDQEFDAVVVDEASMAGLPWMLVMASRAARHLVVVGDPMQLPPIALTSNAAARTFLEQDVFAMVSGASTPGELFAWHDQNPRFTSFFNIQYRMPHGLARVISEVFYEGRLESATQENKLPEGALPAELIDTSGLGPVLAKDKRGSGFQPVNKVHTRVLIDLVQQALLHWKLTPGEIGIIVPFRSAAWHVRREFRKRRAWADLEIGTIHTFQGREKKLIVLDTVMSGEQTSAGARHYSVRPFDEQKNGLSVPRLLNVAFSRSRERLLVLADMRHIHRVYGQKFLGQLLSRLPVRRL